MQQTNIIRAGAGVPEIVNVDEPPIPCDTCDVLLGTVHRFSFTRDDLNDKNIVKNADGSSSLRLKEKYKVPSKEEFNNLCDAGVAFGIGAFNQFKHHAKFMERFTNQELEWSIHNHLQVDDLGPFWGMHWDLRKLKEHVEKLYYLDPATGKHHV